MNLSNIALILTAGLLAFTAYLSLQSRNATNERFDDLEEKIEQSNKEVEEERVANAEEAERWAAENERLRLENERRAKDFAAEKARIEREKAALVEEASVVANNAAAAIEAAEPSKPAVELNPRQQKIKEAASIAEVMDYREEYGFVVLNRGTNSGLVPGMNFVIRRDYFIVGRIKLDSVEEDESIANVVTASIPPGFIIRKGDAVIMGEDAGLF